jgi:hypothetical protein
MAFKKISTRNQFLVLPLVWTLFQLTFYFKFGIVTGYESAKYITQADSVLATGHYASGNFLFYSIEILLIAFSKMANVFPWFVVTVQLLFNALSVCLFYRLCYTISKNSFTAFLFTLIFICMFYYHMYNVHLFTESLYFSFSIIYTYILFSVRKLSIKNGLLVMAALSFLYFTRPTGIFFVPSTLVYIVLRFYRKKARLILSTCFILGLAALYFLLNFALNSGGEFDFLLPYLDERVICGVPTIQGKHEIFVPVEKNSVEGLFYIITHYPSLFFGLAIKRLWAFFGVIRPYFSLGHNLFISAYFYACYLLSAIGLKKMFSNFLPQTSYMLCNICFIVITVTLSCDEWHNRFILALLPFFLLLASGAFIRKTIKHAQ